MAKNASGAGSESRIPVPRTVRPSLLPKLRSTPKIGSAGHRQRNIATPKHFGKSFGEDKESILGDYSVWTDNKEAEHLMRLNDDQQAHQQSLGNLCSQEEDITNFLRNRKPEADDGISENLVDEVEEYEQNIESPATTTTTPPPSHHYLMLGKQNSFEHDHEHDHDESLGILTPDQMTDFTVALDSSRTPSCENLSSNSRNKFLHPTSGSEVVAAAARHLDLATRLPRSIEALSSSLNDRSPSIEDLPLDPKPVVIIAEDVDLLEASLISDKQQPVAPTSLTPRHSTKVLATADSAETSEHTSDQTTRSTSVAGAHVLPTSFITSVTSITSLEAGYQGDGENSRPASRGPEPLSVAPVTKLLVGTTCTRQDPMTDSDFFTESDVDGHEDIVRGDRRAQVIDGTLFCAQSHEQPRCLSLEPEEMDSSGIYSDLEKRQDGVVGEVDAEGDHTTDTGDTEVSMKSQLSPRDQPPVALVIQNALSPTQDIYNLSSDLNSTASTAEVTVIKCQKNEQNTATKSKSNGVSNKENSAPLKKYKMPKRNVTSKIKTMIEANNVKEETDSEPKKPQRQQRKNGRWDAVMNKIEAGKQRPRSVKKEVKSRVFDSLSSTQVATPKRRTRARPDTSNSPKQDTARSSVRSSASDLSKESLKRPNQQSQQRKEQHQNNVHQHLNSTTSQLISNKSNLAPVRKSTAPTSIKSVHQSNGVKQKNNAPATRNKVSERNNRSAATNKDHAPEQIIKNHHNNHHHIFNYTNNNNNNLRSKVTELEIEKPNTREQESQVDLSMVLEEADEDTEQDITDDSGTLYTELLCDRADKTIQALAITVQYLNNQIDSAKIENANLRLQKASLEDKLQREEEQHRASLENLHYELSRANLKEKGLESKLSVEQIRREELEKSLADLVREHRETLDRLVVEPEIELNQTRAQVQQPREHGSLLAEIESLRTVLELRSQEYSTLRSEADLLRREMDDKEVIRHKYESLQARCEDLQAQLQSKEEIERKLLQEHEVLKGSIHQLSEQTMRLERKNEELYWRLRQKNETKLRNQLMSQQTPGRLSKSLYSEHETETYNSKLHDESMNCSFANSSSKSDAYETASSSMIKYMVEKSDSVSWTLDITDDLDGSHSPSRLSEKNGIKRQNSLRLSNQRQTLTPNRSRSSSMASSNDSIRKAAAAAAARVAAATKKESNTTPPWSPSCNSTPNPKSAQQRRRTIADAGETTWSLASNNIMETTITSNSSGNMKSSKVMTALDVLLDEEEAIGQQPQEAGGEAMISEETSATSSSEEDDSSVSSGDIP